MAEDDPGAKLRAELAVLVKRMESPGCPSIAVLLKQSTSGGSGSFLVRADDGNRYWCKCLGNLQSPRVPINEQLVGRLGRLLGAAVCDVSLIRIPEAVAGWEYRPGAKLVPGIAHASRAVEPVVETRQLNHLTDDDNPRRLTTLKLLASLCCSGDPQWLCAVNEENRYYSHDHGHYFPNGPNWTVATLLAAPTQAPGWPTSIKSDTGAEQEFIDRLRAVSVRDIAAVFGGLPSDWPITEQELVEMALYLDGRRARMLDTSTSVK